MDETRPTRKTALLAEDDRDVREVVAALLDVLGYDVVSASDGSEMLEQLANSVSEGGTAIDVVVTDIQMPGMNGVSVVEELRADGWTQPIVVVSAFDDSQIRERLSRLTRCTFLGKPFDVAAFQRALTLVASQTA